MQRAHPKVVGTSGLVLSGHALASQAGAELLRAGGNAVDAAIGAAAVLTVTRPQACTLGGDAFILLHRPSQGTIVLNGSGACPKNLSPASFPNKIPPTGILTATVPTLVKAWGELHRSHGALEWPSLFARAQEWASEGFSLSDDVAGAIERGRPLLEADAGCAAVFLGRKPGDWFRQPALGRVLKNIAVEGSDYFYKGPVARSISDFSARCGGALRLSDFEQAQIEWTEPLSVNYRGLTVQVAPPNSYGLLLLLQLKLLDQIRTNWSHGDDPARLAVLIDVARKAFAEGLDWIADPRFVPRASSLDIDDIARRAAQNVGSTPQNPGGTSVVSAIDADGNAVVLVQSVYAPWGAAVLDPETGILLNNRMRGFSLRDGHPNVLAAGKRPAHTLCPAMVLAGDRLRYLVASPGGIAQTTTIAQLLTNCVDRDIAIAEAVSLPRWSLDESANVILEPSFPVSVLTQLQDRGIGARHGLAHAPFFGSGQIVEVQDNGTAVAASDPRRDDLAVAA